MNYLPNRPININPNKFYSKITTLIVGLAMKAFLKFGCRNVYLLNQDRLLNLIENRSKDQAILTVQNHASTFEDPLLWGMLPTRILGNPDKMRWSLAAREILFTSELKSKFFEYGHIIPVNRGDGVYQESITKAIEVINRGGWVNIYPEGKVNQMEELLPFKWGVGRIILESDIDPIIIPMYHSGMADLLPEHRKKIPKLGKTLVFSCGEPFSIKDKLSVDHSKMTKEELRSHVTELVRIELDKLRIDTLSWMRKRHIEPYFYDNLNTTKQVNFLVGKIKS